jgi:hypothetical protein
MFVMKRKDEKDATNAQIKKAIEELSHRISENQAILARTHILRFSDECKNGVVHSSEYWKQTLMDIDTYENYCQENHSFKNSYAEASIAYIKSTYSKLLEERKL